MVSENAGASAAPLRLPPVDDRSSSTEILMLFSSWRSGDLMWNVRDSAVPVNFTECLLGTAAMLQ